MNRMSRNLFIKWKITNQRSLFSTKVNSGARTLKCFETLLSKFKKFYHWCIHKYTMTLFSFILCMIFCPFLFSHQTKSKNLIWLYQLSWKCKLATVTGYKADISSSDEGLTLETSALQLVTVANLHFQLSWYNQITLLPPPTQHYSFFRNFHSLFMNLRMIALQI